MSIINFTGLTKRVAAEQGGVISGDNPVIYNATDPFRLWIIQVVLIIVTTRVCFALFYKIRQPRVVAEILGGIVLGPTLLGRIPNFSTTIFPAPSIPILQLCATFGLIVFLFNSALEVDLHRMNRNLKASVAVCLAGLVIPAAFGCILSVILYYTFSDPSTVNFGHFTLFTVVSISITAFPILCRMLAELSLYHTKLGAIVISAGVVNDIVGWVLLAAAVSLANSKSGLTALWILLVCLAYTLFCWYPVRLAYRWLAIRTGTLQTGEPNAVMITLAFLMLLVNGFFTDMIGLHAIFGGFLSGLLIPHDNGFAKALLLRTEDLNSNIFLPIYFTLSGLKTDLGLLNTGKAWGYTVIVCLIAYLGKFLGCGCAARCVGFTTREACAIGTLMACKGLLELIVINLGLQAGILTTKLFAMFVVHAMVLTVFITPVTALIYPEKYRMHIIAADTTRPPDLDSSLVVGSDDTKSERDITIVAPV